jgi:hypothetical protein
MGDNGVDMQWKQRAGAGAGSAAPSIRHCGRLSKNSKVQLENLSIKKFVEDGKHRPTQVCCTRSVSGGQRYAVLCFGVGVDGY